MSESTPEYPDQDVRLFNNRIGLIKFSIPGFRSVGIYTRIPRSGWWHFQHRDPEMYPSTFKYLKLEPYASTLEYSDPNVPIFNARIRNRTNIQLNIRINFSYPDSDDWIFNIQIWIPNDLHLKTRIQMFDLFILGSGWCIFNTRIPIRTDPHWNIRIRMNNYLIRGYGWWHFLILESGYVRIHTEISGYESIQINTWIIGSGLYGSTLEYPDLDVRLSNVNENF